MLFATKLCVCGGLVVVVANAGVGAVEAVDGADTLYDDTVGPFAGPGVGLPAYGPVSMSILPNQCHFARMYTRLRRGKQSLLQADQRHEQLFIAVPVLVFKSCSLIVKMNVRHEMAARLIEVSMKKQVS